METNGDGKERLIELHQIARADIRDLGEVKQLFLEYAASLDLDLSFQDFASECETLPGKYGEPDGALLIMRVDGKAAGCIALRNIADGICEMKRLYVRDAYRGLGLGKILIQAVMEKAAQLQYAYIRLDTLPSMAKAQTLYRSFGFYEIEPYVFNPIEGTKFMEAKLLSNAPDSTK